MKHFAVYHVRFRRCCILPKSRQEQHEIHLNGSYQVVISRYLPLASRQTIPYSLPESDSRFRCRVRIVEPEGELKTHRQPPGSFCGVSSSAAVLKDHCPKRNGGGTDRAAWSFTRGDAFAESTSRALSVEMSAFKYCSDAMSALSLSSQAMFSSRPKSMSPSTGVR